MMTQFTAKIAPYRMVEGYFDTCGISLLLSAAVVNQGFRDLLLTDPDLALSEGYYGQEFPLTREEKDLVLSVRAENLSELALKIVSLKETGIKASSGCWAPAHQPALAFRAE